MLQEMFLWRFPMFKVMGVAAIFGHLDLHCRQGGKPQPREVPELISQLE